MDLSDAALIKAMDEVMYKVQYDEPVPPVPIPDDLEELHRTLMCNAMANHEKGGGGVSVEYWPAKEHRIFYSTNLKETFRRPERFLMALFFFQNGVMKELVIEWFKKRGAFDYPKEHREAEFRAIFVMLDNLANDPATKWQLGKYNAYHVGSGKRRSLLEPITEQDNAYLKGFYIN
jgi:hypothetical protein